MSIYDKIDKVRWENIPSHNVEEVTYPRTVPGRVAHIDADFLAYQVSAETRDELDGIKPRKSLEDMRNNARRAAEHLQRLVGADTYVCHVTASASTKGGRPDQAVQHEYQAGRKGRDKPEFLDAIRAFIGTELNGAVHLDQEADDGMAQANYAIYRDTAPWGDMMKSVIVSKDKDLRMVPGLHWDFDEEVVFCVNDSFGKIWVDDKGSSKTVKGWGTKFFWAQCLMGDSADSIKGLPKATIVPGRFKLCGPVMAAHLLDGVENDKDAFHLVKHQWTELDKHGEHEFTHWRTGERVTATQALLGDMLLLWMRRNKNPRDVLDWVKETCA